MQIGLICIYSFIYVRLRKQCHLPIYGQYPLISVRCSNKATTHTLKTSACCWRYEYRKICTCLELLTPEKWSLLENMTILCVYILPISVLYCVHSGVWQPCYLLQMLSTLFPTKTKATDRWRVPNCTVEMTQLALVSEYKHSLHRFLRRSISCIVSHIARYHTKTQVKAR